MDLPKGWVAADFEDAVQILDIFREPINSTERAARIEGIPHNKLFPYYGATGLVGYIDKYLLDGEYVLLGEDGAPFLDSFSKKAYIVTGKVWVNNHAHVLLSKMSNLFLCHYLNQFSYKSYVSGTTRLKLPQGSMKTIPIIVPPLAEQHRIVAKIDALFSRLEKGVETLQAIQQQLRTYRQAVLKWAFEGLFTKTTFTQSVLKDFIEKPRYGTSKKCAYDSGSTAVIRIPNIDYSLGRINYSDVKYATFTIEETEPLKLNVDDILIIRSNGSASLVARAAIIKEHDVANLFAGYLMRLRIKTDDLLPQFLLHYLSSPNARLYIEIKAKSTSGVHNINSDEIAALPIPVCTPSEQATIVAEIESRLSICDKLEAIVEENLSKAQALKQSILKKAFAGQLVPQDPNDEPAEKLLECIKAKKHPKTVKSKVARKSKGG